MAAEKEREKEREGLEISREIIRGRGQIPNIPQGR